jgi:hypothetical protein
MNGAVEDLLREGLDRLAGDADVPAGLAHRARTRQRRRKMATRTALACGTAAVAATAVIVAAGPGRGLPAPVQARATAYVMWRMRNALADKNAVIRTEFTFSPAFPAITQWTYHKNERSVQTGVLHVPGVPWAQGTVHWVDGTTVINGKRAWIEADYRQREWYTTGQSLILPNGCKSSLDLAEFNQTNWATFVPQTLSCGRLRVAGHAWIDGKPAIRIVGSMTERNWWGGHGEGRGPLKVYATMYVDPSTYLPVRVIWSNWTHWRDGKPLHGTITEQISALAPTPANVAKASITIPARFRRVSGSRPPFGGPMTQFFG